MTRKERKYLQLMEKAQLFHNRKDAIKIINKATKLRVQIAALSSQ